MSKIYYNYDEANGEVNMRNANYRVWGKGWYLKRHFRRDWHGGVFAYKFTIHRHNKRYFDNLNNGVKDEKSEN